MEGLKRFKTRLDGEDKSSYVELFKRYPNNPILTPANWPYPSNAVFNPGVTRIGEKVLLLVRVEDRRGFSHLTTAVSKDGVTNWKIDTVPTLESDPENFPEEIWGIEDPRITYIEELTKWAIVYTAYSGGGPLVSIAFTSDFKTFEKQGAVLRPEDKDGALFPRKFQGKWLLVHRPISDISTPGAHIWLSKSEDLKYWGDQQILINARRGGWWDANKVGLCTPPLETSEGWIILYHGVRQTASGSIYRLGIALLDLEDPSKLLRRSDEWIFGPRERYENEGDVSGVVFPCGWVLDKETDIIKMYYGCADTSVSLATAKLRDLLDYLNRCPDPSQEIGQYL